VNPTLAALLVLGAGIFLVLAYLDDRDR